MTCDFMSGTGAITRAVNNGETGMSEPTNPTAHAKQRIISAIGMLSEVLIDIEVGRKGYGGLVRSIANELGKLPLLDENDKEVPPLWLANKDEWQRILRERAAKASGQ